MTYKIQTITGRRIDPWLITPSDVSIEDISHALSMQCRYAGHVKEFYSVAQHSVIVANEVLRRTDRNTDRTMAALLHDASEAYLGDMTRPVKRHPQMEPYRVVEQNVQRTINEAFGLDPDAHTDDVIIQVDRDILYWEQEVLCHAVTVDCMPKPQDAIARIHPWNTRDAKLVFLNTYLVIRDGLQ